MPALNGYALTTHFRKLRQRVPVSHLQAYLFFELVAICNEGGWPAEFSVTNPALMAGLGCTEEGLNQARKKLREFGLIDFASGTRRTPTRYWFTVNGLTHLSHPTAPATANPPTEGSGELDHSAAKTTNPPTIPPTEGSGELDPLNKGKQKKINSAAHAAPPTLLSGKGNSSTKLTARQKKAAALAGEIAALPLPHGGESFAHLWATFRAGPKQAGKPVSAFELLLKKLGKYAEGFACVMLEKSIESNWSGVEYESTPAAYVAWQVAEAERLRRQPVRTNPPTADEPALNHDFLAQIAARQQAEQDAHFAQWQARPQADTDALFGYTQSAAEGLAQARAEDPDYQRYLAEEAAKDSEPTPPDPDNPPDLGPQPPQEPRTDPPAPT